MTAARSASARAIATSYLFLPFSNAEQYTVFQSSRSFGITFKVARVKLMSTWDADQLRAAVRVYLLADTGLVPPEDLLEVVSAAIRGGVTAVQLRAKMATTLEQLGAGTRPQGDLRAGQRAVHRQRSGRRGAGRRKPTAPTSDTLARRTCRRRTRGGCWPQRQSSASRWAPQRKRTPPRRRAPATCRRDRCSPRRPSRTRPATGETLPRSVRVATGLPVVVIGGITPQRSAPLFAAGADGVCVGAAILRSPDPEAAARAFTSSAGREGRSQKSEVRSQKLAEF